MNRRCLLAIALTLAGAPPVLAGEPAIFTGLVDGVAVGGYDAVSYFRDGEPRPGKAEFAVDWQGVGWRFASAENLSAFQASPEKYAPQYGGYCAYAVSKGATAKGDPLAWTIAGGKLYLNYSPAVRATWRSDVAGNIAKADANWPAVLN